MKKQKHFYIFLPLLFTILIDALGVGIVYPVFAMAFSTTGHSVLVHGLSESTASIYYGITVAAFPVAMLFGAPILGDLSDHLGRKKILIICLFGEALGMVLSAVALEFNSILFLILARAFTGLLAGSMGLAQAAIVDISTPNNKTVNLSLISFAAALGFILGPLIGGELASLKFISGIGYAGPFLFAGILAFVNGIFLFTSFSETAKICKSTKISPLKGIRLFLNGFKDIEFRYLSIILLLFQMCWSLYFQTNALSMVVVFGYDISGLGHFLAYLSLIYAFSMLVLIRIAVRLFSLENIMKGSIVLYFIGFSISSMMILSMAWIAVPFLSIGFGLGYMAILTLYSNLADGSSQGWAMGSATSISSGAWAIGSIIAGIIISFSFTASYLTAAFIVVICFIFAVKHVKRTKTKQHQTVK